MYQGNKLLKKEISKLIQKQIDVYGKIIDTSKEKECLERIQNGENFWVLKQKENGDRIVSFGAEGQYRIRPLTFQSAMRERLHLNLPPKQRLIKQVINLAPLYTGIRKALTQGIKSELLREQLEKERSMHKTDKRRKKQKSN